jgi:hypothetical protein
MKPVRKNMLRKYRALIGQSSCAAASGVTHGVRSKIKGEDSTTPSPRGAFAHTLTQHDATYLRHSQISCLCPTGGGRLVGTVLSSAIALTADGKRADQSFRFRRSRYAATWPRIW